MPDNAFRHLDPSTTKVYRGTVLYGFESDTMCFLIKVKNGYVVETPEYQNSKWIRGQHIETLNQYFTQIKPLRLIAEGY